MMLNEIVQAIADTRRDYEDTGIRKGQSPADIDRYMAAAVVAVIRNHEYLSDPFIMAIPEDILNRLTMKQVGALGMAMADAVVALFRDTT